MVKMEDLTQISRNDPEYMIGGTLFRYQKGLDVFVERDVPSNKIMMYGRKIPGRSFSLTAGRKTFIRAVSRMENGRAMFS